MRHAFSLVELSIVLVILGLLVGGILAGQSLIRASELRSVSSDITKIRTALNGFRDKYFALPGDMANATAFWGAQATPAATCIALTTPASGTATCDGNGDGAISPIGAGVDQEEFRFWQHLANGGLIEGSYTGVAGPTGGAHHVPGSNCMASKMSGTGFSVQYRVSNSARYLGGIIREPLNLLHFGKGNSSNITAGAALLADEAWNIDTKLDDGLPGTGQFRQFANGFAANCVSDDSFTATYQLGNTTRACIGIIPLQQ